MPSTNNSIGLYQQQDSTVIYPDLASGCQSVANSLLVPNEQSIYIAFSNLGFKYSGGTFTICGSDGSALSATNPAIMTQRFTSIADVRTLAITRNFSFTDGASGTLTGARFGLTANVDWPNDIPFYIYWCNDSSGGTGEYSTSIAISRSPSMQRLPTITGISTPSSIVNVNQEDVFFLENIDKSLYTSQKAQIIGSFRMTFTGATNSWTVSSLSATDGLNKWNDARKFTIPSGQLGCAAGTYIVSNAGTEPVWTTSAVDYYLKTTGQVLANYVFSNASTAGVGAQTCQIVSIGLSGQGTTIPFTIETTVPLIRCATAFMNTGNTAFTEIIDSTGSLTNAAFSLGCNVYLSGTYQSFDWSGT